MQTVAASNTQDLYDQHTNLWVRSSPTILSDYTARPRVLQRIGDVRGLSVLDLGCGEGYVARELARAGAERIVGMDLSSKMVQAAQEQNKEDLYPISYSVEDLRQWSEPKSEYDRAVAVFLFNYLNVQDSIEVLTKTHRALRSGRHDPAVPAEEAAQRAPQRGAAPPRGARAARGGPEEVGVPARRPAAAARVVLHLLPAPRPRARAQAAPDG